MTVTIVDLKLPEEILEKYTNCLVKTRESFESFDSLSEAEEDIDPELKASLSTTLNSFVGNISSKPDYTYIENSREYSNNQESLASHLLDF